MQHHSGSSGSFRGGNPSRSSQSRSREPKSQPPESGYATSNRRGGALEDRARLENSEDDEDDDSPVRGKSRRSRHAVAKSGSKSKKAPLPSDDDEEFDFEDAFASRVHLKSSTPISQDEQDSQLMASPSPERELNEEKGSARKTQNRAIDNTGASELSASGPISMPTPPLSSSRRKMQAPPAMESVGNISTTPITTPNEMARASRARRKELRSPSPLESDHIGTPSDMQHTPPTRRPVSMMGLQRFSTPPPLTSADHARRVIGERWHGRLDYANSSYYSGGLLKREDGQVVRDGVGVAFDAVKNKIFEGNFENDLKTGYGITKYIDKIHQGEYLRGLRHGFGVFVFANGERYEGEFSKGEFHGEGKFVWTDGSRFDGTFRKGKLRKGVKHWPMKAGETFEGGFDDSGQPSGFGITRYANGSYHRGMYKHGKPHGRGEFFDIEEGKIIMQEYFHGVPDKKSPGVVVAPIEGPARFMGERTGNEWTGVMIGPSAREDEDIPEADQVRVQIGSFTGSTIPIDLVEGTYLTSHSQVTASRFDAGPYVPDSFAATWHDLETGNARWARLGPERQGPIGSAMFMIASTDTARLEKYNREGELASTLTI